MIHYYSCAQTPNPQKNLFRSHYYIIHFEIIQKQVSYIQCFIFASTNERWTQCGHKYI